MAEWTEEMSVGVEILDRDHRVLFGLLNKLKSAIQNDTATRIMGEVVTELYDYADYHFRREEAMMLLCGYPELADHKALHAEITSRIERFLSPPPANSETQFYSELLEFMENWLTGHIMVVDKAYGPCFVGVEGIEKAAEAGLKKPPESGTG